MMPQLIMYKLSLHVGKILAIITPDKHLGHSTQSLYLETAESTLHLETWPARRGEIYAKT